MTKPLRDVQVLEIAGSAAGSYAAKLFSQRGAQVIKLLGADKPTPPSANEGIDASSTSLYLDHGKEIRVAHSPERSDSADLLHWLEWADVVIESSAPDPLQPQKDAENFPQLVRVRISPFGSTGPYQNYRSNEFSDDAMGGQLYLNGEADREPIDRPGLQAHYQAGLHGFIGALAALRTQGVTGSGQLVEVNHFEGLVSMHQHTISMWTHGHYVLKREGNRQPGIWHPAGIYPCKDGHIMLILVTQEHRDRFLIAAGIPELSLDPRFANDLTVGQNKDAFDAAILPWLLDHTRDEILAIADESQTPPRPVVSPLEFIQDSHLAARGYWQTCEEHKIPGRAFSILEYPDEPNAGEIEQPIPSEPLPSPHMHPNDSKQENSAPLEGIRVLDLTRVWAGPLAGRFLADLGADVIVIESPSGRGARQVPSGLAKILHCFPNNEPGERPWNRIGFLNKLHRNKRGITLDLKQPEARRIFEGLVEKADVVLENFSPRVMRELGLDLDRLRQLNPCIIHTGISGYGISGPHRDRLAFGPVIESSSGTSHSMGYRDSGPYRSGVAWADPISALHAVAATMVALADRQCDRRATARYVEMPMIEAMASVNGERLLEAQRQGVNPARRGSRHPDRAPQGVYPCAGTDRWIAISIESDEEWRELCRLGLPNEFAELDASERHARHDDIDAQLAVWTRTLDAMALERKLQASGIIAAAVRNARDLCDDEQLSLLDFWTQTSHPEAGIHAEPGCAIHLSKNPVTYRRAAPCLGEHNEEVLKEILGLDDQELGRLSELGILTQTPP